MPLSEAYLEPVQISIKMMELSCGKGEGFSCLLFSQENHPNTCLQRSKNAFVIYIKVFQYFETLSSKYQEVLE